jgi:hypothetical protein
MKTYKGKRVFFLDKGSPGLKLATGDHSYSFVPSDGITGRGWLHSELTLQLEKVNLAKDLNDLRGHFLVKDEYDNTPIMVSNERHPRFYKVKKSGAWVGIIPLGRYYKLVR